MRVFKDIGMVEQLGPGVPRILKATTKNASIFLYKVVKLVVKLIF
jgi:predicted HTH transcriptional regulator